MGGNMKKIFILLTTLALLTLTACISKDAKGKLEETTTPPSTVVVPETPVAPAVPVELITNGDFLASTGWTTNKGWSVTQPDFDVTYAGTAAIKIIRGGSPNAYEAQFYQEVPIESGKTYTVSFDYSGTVDSPFKTVIEKDGGSPSYLDETLKASNTEQKYTKTFTASATEPKVKVGFYFGSTPTSAAITIDNVSLKEATTK